MALVHALHLLFSHLTVLLLLVLTSKGNGHSDDCPESFDCGNLGLVGYPFTTVEFPNCGALAIQGCDDLNKTATKHVQFTKGGKHFQVTNIKNERPNTISIVDLNFTKLLQKNACEAFSYDITLPPPSPFGTFYMKDNITAFKCSHTQKLASNPPNNFFKNSTCPRYDFYFGDSTISNDEPNHSFTSCFPFHLPVIKLGFALSGNPFRLLADEITFNFKSSYYCRQCYYRDKKSNCRAHINGQIYCAARTKIIPPASLLFRKESSTHQIIEEFIKEHGPLPTARYNYSDVKKITHSFRNILGQGGFGSVYQGKLPDECVIAVKVLSESKGDGEDFINEVASISRTSHINVVRLLGFCLDGSKKALIYEFMSNGYLEKFIYEEKNPLKDDRQLDCKTLYNIAVGRCSWTRVFS
ncbi:putative glycerophosphodiester phosphodiesterase, protein kinase RLK-Pelle-LRK10L-2 family [Medicago truncatula]|uniref:Putative glycerophosphodiester phosphodiesterase, protein kinase RLK-Pelle-LRK10L-2 family n=1 Tax=Medicago truncatula TaxID=3880 RepID=A0A396JVM3_MEDTR|nr:putative glycerophosphodiester phosphodiesterase, protein kinase RLK-Pelle-LRK10L-2 family [Medicago truncatula]